MRVDTIEELRKHEWTISWSGGKDSMATVILAWCYHIPVKEVVHIRMMYSDTIPATYKIQTEFVDHALRVIQDEFGFKVRVVKSLDNMLDLASRTYVRPKDPEMIGKTYGMNATMRGHCKMTDSKQRTMKSLAKATDSNAMFLVGIAHDEPERLESLYADVHQASILDVIHMSEADCMSYCRSWGLLSPLYDLGLTNREGCFFCPNAKKKEIEYIVQNEPELYELVHQLYDLTYYRPYQRKLNNWIKYLEDNGVEKRRNIT